ncbi:MAG: hypothetical protein ACOC97_01875 [Myxococcota bacterium]
MNQTTVGSARLTAVLSASLLAFAGCGDGGAGAGSLRVLLEPEDVVIEGLEPGDGGEDIRDGWAVTFDRYLLAVGDIDLHFATDPSREAEAPEVHVVDLTQLSPSGLSLWTLDGLREGRWEVWYATPGAADGSMPHDDVAEEDHDAMIASDWTYLVDGVLTKADGESCPPAALATPGDRTPNGNTSGGNDCYDAPSVRFTFGATAETTYGPCEADGVQGVAIAAGATQTAALTIHGDHLFFNGFPEGAEGGVSRLAQWLADCDLDLDGTVTREELEAIAPSDLPEIDDRFQLGGSPITPLADMYDYAIAQLKTQGHFQGEGECPIDGAEHDHGHH